ncbi:MAG TPA: hypothetical protein PKH37_09350 [Alphaproteobacteria bacterium]|nr:hypothetical protein [Alphaproteobacteria bacterium]
MYNDKASVRGKNSLGGKDDRKPELGSEISGPDRYSSGREKRRSDRNGGTVGDNNSGTSAIEVPRAAEPYFRPAVLGVDECDQNTADTMQGPAESLESSGKGGEIAWPKAKAESAEAKAKARAKAAPEGAELPGTEKTRQLCSEIAAASGGVCFLGFSRGKDSIASWLWLQKFFDRIIPFHCASVPGLSFVDESLEYYEEYFQTKIERCISGDIMHAISNLVFQPIEDEQLIDSLEIVSYDNHQVFLSLRAKYNLPNAWCAFGINASDSIDRRIYVNKCNGRHDHRQTFYPCYDWTRAQILDAVSRFGVKLPKDYLLANRTLASIPNLRHLINMEKEMPDELARVELVFPFIRARLARNEFRKGKAHEGPKTETDSDEDSE